MSFIKSLFRSKEIKDTVFYKDFIENNYELKKLMEISSNIKNNKKILVDGDIDLLKSQINGENNVYYELKNSFVPMICLYDITIEEGDYRAQLDFVAITNKYIMILEISNLTGDIYVNESGDFIRNIKNKYGKVVKTEPEYSPIAKNDRNIRIVKDILIKNKIIDKCPIISGVVIANSKGIIDRTHAPSKIKNEIFRYDQITETLNKNLNNNRNFVMSDSVIKKIAEFLIASNKSIDIDYMEKYSLTNLDFIENIRVKEITTNNKLKEVEYKNYDSDENLVARLKEYRLNTSRAEQVKAYCIFKNETLEDIVKLKPKNKQELMGIRGFGQVKAEKYGDGIIDIINNK